MAISKANETAGGGQRRWGKRHPWAEWFAMAEFVAERGVDYGCRTDTMMSQIRQKAAKLGKSVSITASDDGAFISVKVWENVTQ